MFFNEWLLVLVDADGSTCMTQAFVWHKHSLQVYVYGCIGRGRVGWLSSKPPFSRFARYSIRKFRNYFFCSRCSRSFCRLILIKFSQLKLRRSSDIYQQGGIYSHPEQCIEFELCTAPSLFEMELAQPIQTDVGWNNEKLVKQIRVHLPHSLLTKKKK